MVAPPTAMHSVRLAPLAPGERIEVALDFPAERATAGALVCSPQPFLGGDLDTNVTRAVARALAAAGAPVLRFNYRAVGKSRDVDPSRARFDWWRDVEARGDRAAVAEDAREAFARASRWFEVTTVVGYSFGASVALDLALGAAPRATLVLVGPPFGKIDFAALADHAGRAAVVVAGADELDPAPPRDALVARFPSAEITVFAGADHFFRGREDEVAEHVARFARAGVGAPGAGARR